ncbi:MAG: type II toxin-antitoxin system VapC family toxin [Acidobacteriota bacterium]
MSYLLDTNVISELRRGERADPNVLSWYSALEDEEILLSVLTVGEIRRGIESIRLRDRDAAAALDSWLHRVVARHGDRIVSSDQPIADAWGRLNVPDPLPVVDGLLVATAKVKGLTLATRNVKDIERTGIDFVNPFDPSR